MSKQLTKDNYQLAERFIQDEKGIIRDTKTNLEWQVGPDKDTTWAAAKTWVDSLGEGWRLPTVQELQGLYEEGKGTRNIDPVFGMNGWWVWSTSSGSSFARTFSFYYGCESSGNRGYSRFSRGFSVRSRR